MICKVIRETTYTEVYWAVIAMGKFLTSILRNIVQLCTVGVSHDVKWCSAKTLCTKYMYTCQKKLITTALLKDIILCYRYTHQCQMFRAKYTHIFNRAGILPEVLKSLALA